jgi:hypothetical protein
MCRLRRIRATSPQRSVAAPVRRTHPSRPRSICSRRGFPFGPVDWTAGIRPTPPKPGPPAVGGPAARKQVPPFQRGSARKLQPAWRNGAACGERRPWCQVSRVALITLRGNRRLAVPGYRFPVALVEPRVQRRIFGGGPFESANFAGSIDLLTQLANSSYAARRCSNLRCSKSKFCPRFKRKEANNASTRRRL